MTNEIESRRKYRLAGEPVFNNPLFDQSFERQSSGACNLPVTHP